MSKSIYTPAMVRAIGMGRGAEIVEHAETVRFIQVQAASAFGVHLSDLLGRFRWTKVCQARKVAMVAAMRVTGLPAHSIAVLFNRTDPGGPRAARKWAGAQPASVVAMVDRIVEMAGGDA